MKSDSQDTPWSTKLIKFATNSVHSSSDGLRERIRQRVRGGFVRKKDIDREGM
jgi:hypothetical protein